MRTYELVQEERLDEAFPLIAGISVPVILGYVSTAITAYSVFELYQFISKYNEDPDSITEDEWSDLFVDLILTVVPGLGKIGKPLILKMIPRSLQKAGGRYIENQIKEKLAKDQAGILKKYGPSKQAGKTPAEVRELKARRRLELAAANKAAKLKLDKLRQSTPIYDAIVSGIGAGIYAKLFVDFWEERSLLEEQYKRVSAGDLTGFEGMTQQEAMQKIIDDSNKLVGKLMLAVAPVVAKLGANASLAAFKGLFGWVPVVGKYAKGAIDLTGTKLINPLMNVISKNGPAVAAFMQTETGKRLLENQIVSSILTVSGAIGKGVYEGLLELIKFAGNAVGLNAAAVDTLKPNIPTAQRATQSANSGQSQSSKRLQLMMDPKNNNIKFVNGHQVTGPDGYLLNYIPNTINDIQNIAKAFDLPNPIEQLKRDPNKQYTGLQ